MKLTEDQKNILDAFFPFLAGTERFWIIDGPGGAGKSALIAEMLKEFWSGFTGYCGMLGIKPTIKGVRITSTTHKAAESLEGLLYSSWPALNQQQVNIPTIHNQLGLTVKYDKEKQCEVLVQNKIPKLEENLLFIIDEASMIDNVLLKHILKDIPESCKIIMVGDRYQLPPVKIHESPVYSSSWNVPVMQLNKLIRFKHEDLKKLAVQLREDTANRHITSISVTGQHIHWLNRQQADALINKHFKNQKDKAWRILAYSNRAVHSYARKINQLQGYQDDLIHVGQEVVVNTIAVNYCGRHNTTTPSYHSGSFWVTTETRGVILRIERLSTYIRWDNENRVLLTGPSIQPDKAGRDFFIENGKDGIWFDMVTLDTHKGVVECLYCPPDLIKKVVRKYRDTYQHMHLIADIRPGYAMTVHKSQGSTIPNVIVDVSDLGRCTQGEIYQKLLYVACTRASENLYLIGTPPEKYGDIYLTGDEDDGEITCSGNQD